MKTNCFTLFIIFSLIMPFAKCSTYITKANNSYLKQASTQHSTYWYWKDHFNSSEKKKLKSWIEKTMTGIKQLVGNYPFDIHIYFHRLNNAKEPVPWAHTQRSNKQGVHFYVDPSFDTKDFLSDWTAPHELSHLIIPYVNQVNAWFAEGFASFMQYQVMYKMSLLTQQQITDRYKKRIKRAANKYQYHKHPFAYAANLLRLKRDYPTFYWGGAVYFFQVDQKLKAEEKGSFIELLNQFLICCYDPEDSLQDLVKKFDTISKTTAFSEQLKIFNNKVGFPDYSTIF